MRLCVNGETIKLNITALEYLYLIDMAGSLQNAAETIGACASNMRRPIRDLEGQLGTTLVVSVSNKGLLLTNAGSDLVTIYEAFAKTLENKMTNIARDSLAIPGETTGSMENVEKIQ